MFDYVVVGAGLFGSAAARSLSMESASVAVVGPAEPPNVARHRGVFASHYDQGRLQRHFSRDVIWAILSHRAFKEYAELERESGVRFYWPVDSVHLAPKTKDSVFIESAEETAARLGIDYTVIPSGSEIAERLPMLRFPADCHGYVEHSPAGYVNPRDLIRAQLTVAASRGAQVFRETVVGMEKRGDHSLLRTDRGTKVEAGKVLVAAGAYTNELMPRKLALRVKSETILLAEVSKDEVSRLAGMPSLIYELDAPPIDTIYMLPPILYPDGKFYIKMGCNTAADRYLETAEEMNDWVRSGNSDGAKAAMIQAMRDMIPGLDAGSFETRRCLVTYTPYIWPYIDAVEDERLYVAAGGNGMGAKGGACIGKLAAELMIHSRWTDEIEPHHFRAYFEDEMEAFDWGACGMAKQRRDAPRPDEGAVTASRQGGGAGDGVRIRRADSLSFEAACDVEMSYLYPWGGVVDTPFGSAVAVVGPGQTTSRHMHHEGETWVMTAGRGVLSSGCETHEVSAGDVIYLPPFSDHTLHNPSEKERAVFLTVWWEDMKSASRRGQARHERGEESARYFVTSTPPTPNGDLHLGHLAGPYLGADIYTRALRMSGREAYHITGSDDFQSYVAGKAIETDQSPQAVADHYAARLHDALLKANVDCDQFTRTQDPDYVTLIQEMVTRLYDGGHIVAEECEYPTAATDGRHLYEFYIHGSCPYCGSPAGGGGCEECGRPNGGVDLVDPMATLGGEVKRTTVRRLVVPLHRHADRLRAFLDRASMPTHVRSLVDRLLEDGVPNVPVTHPHHWGIPCPVAGFEGQVISTWFEMGHSLLAGIQQLARRKNWATSEGFLAPAGDARIVQFFGFDNAFYYTFLYPVLYQLVDPDFDPPATLVCNEFYLLDGLKFSTSRGHAIWVRDFLNEEPADLVRLYLAATRPEASRTSFSLNAYREFTNREPLGRWQSWFQDLHERLHAAFDGVAPEPGLWTDRQRDYYHRLDTLLRRTRPLYDAATFSPRSVTHNLMELVRMTTDFATGERHWAAVAQRRDEHRTALALELAAALGLAHYIAPIMPDLAEGLFAGLGVQGLALCRRFSDQVLWVPAGTSVDLSQDFFDRAHRDAA